MRTFFFLGVLAALAGCSGDDPAANDAPLFVYQIPEVTSDGWQTSTLADEGIDEDAIVSLMNEVKGGRYGAIDGLVIARNGKLVLEEYYNGYDRETRHDAWSVTKSVVSMLVGVARRSGYLPDLEQKVLPLFPEYSPYGEWDDRKNAITIRHLLTMSTGLDCDDTDPSSFGREAALFGSQDWISHFLELPMLRDPGAEFRYCAGSVVALSGVIEKYTGMASSDFAHAYLLDPLGISASWSVGPLGRLHANGLSIRPRDMAKLGQVMLDGTWYGQQILEEDWIQQSTSHQIDDQDGESAGFLWWRSGLTVDGNFEDVFFALGAGGQAITVIPSHATVVVLTGNMFGDDALFYQVPLMMQIARAL